MWRFLKYFLITVLVVVVLVCTTVGIVLNFIFTPEKLTPVVGKTANELLNAEVHFDSIELTFFSTFPNFGLEIRNGSVVTKVFQDTTLGENVYSKTDSLMSFELCRLTINPMDYLAKKDIVVKELRIEKPRIYAYINQEGMPAWDVMRTVEADTLTVEADTTSESLFEGIDIKNIRVEDGYLVFDDRANQLYARVEGFGLKIDGDFSGRKFAIGNEGEKFVVVARRKFTG